MYPNRQGYASNPGQYRTVTNVAQYHAQTTSGQYNATMPYDGPGMMQQTSPTMYTSGPPQPLLRQPAFLPPQTVPSMMTMPVTTFQPAFQATPTFISNAKSSVHVRHPSGGSPTTSQPPSQGMTYYTQGGPFSPPSPASSQDVGHSLSSPRIPPPLFRPGPNDTPVRKSSVTENAHLNKAEKEELYRTFGIILQQHGPMEVTDKRVLSAFMSMSPYLRQGIKYLGGLKEFFRQGDIFKIEKDVVLLAWQEIEDMRQDLSSADTKIASTSRTQAKSPEAKKDFQIALDKDSHHAPDKASQNASGTSGEVTKKPAKDSDADGDDEWEGEEEEEEEEPGWWLLDPLPMEDEEEEWKHISPLVGRMGGGYFDDFRKIEEKENKDPDEIQKKLFKTSTPDVGTKQTSPKDEIPRKSPKEREETSAASLSWEQSTTAQEEAYNLTHHSSDQSNAAGSGHSLVSPLGSTDQRAVKSQLSGQGFDNGREAGKAMISRPSEAKKPVSSFEEESWSPWEEEEKPSSALEVKSLNALAEDEEMITASEEGASQEEEEEEKWEEQDEEEEWEEDEEKAEDEGVEAEELVNRSGSLHQAEDDVILVEVVEEDTTEEDSVEDGDDVEVVDKEEEGRVIDSSWMVIDEVGNETEDYQSAIDTRDEGDSCEKSSTSYIPADGVPKQDKYKAGTDESDIAEFVADYVAEVIANSAASISDSPEDSLEDSLEDSREDQRTLPEGEKVADDSKLSTNNNNNNIQLKSEEKYPTDISSSQEARGSDVDVSQTNEDVVSHRSVGMVTDKPQMTHKAVCTKEIRTRSCKVNTIVHAMVSRGTDTGEDPRIEAFKTKLAKETQKSHVLTEDVEDLRDKLVLQKNQHAIESRSVKQKLDQLTRELLENDRKLRGKSTVETSELRKTTVELKDTESKLNAAKSKISRADKENCNLTRELERTTKQLLELERIQDLKIETRTYGTSTEGLEPKVEPKVEPKKEPVSKEASLLKMRARSSEQKVLELQYQYAMQGLNQALQESQYIFRMYGNTLLSSSHRECLRMKWMDYQMYIKEKTDEVATSYYTALKSLQQDVPLDDITPIGSKHTETFNPYRSPTKSQDFQFYGGVGSQAYPAPSMASEGLGQIGAAAFDMYSSLAMPQMPATSSSQYDGTSQSVRQPPPGISAARDQAQTQLPPGLSNLPVGGGDLSMTFMQAQTQHAAPGKVMRRVPRRAPKAFLAANFMSSGVQHTTKVYGAKAPPPVGATAGAMAGSTGLFSQGATAAGGRASPSSSLVHDWLDTMEAPAQTQAVPPKPHKLPPGLAGPKSNTPMEMGIKPVVKEEILVAPSSTLSRSAGIGRGRPLNERSMPSGQPEFAFSQPKSMDGITMETARRQRTSSSGPSDIARSISGGVTDSKTSSRSSSPLVQDPQGQVLRGVTSPPPKLPPGFKRVSPVGAPAKPATTSSERPVPVFADAKPMFAAPKLRPASTGHVKTASQFTARTDTSQTDAMKARSVSVGGPSRTPSPGVTVSSSLSASSVAKAIPTTSTTITAQSQLLSGSRASPVLGKSIASMVPTSIPGSMLGTSQSGNTSVASYPSGGMGPGKYAPNMVMASFPRSSVGPTKSMNTYTMAYSGGNLGLCKIPDLGVTSYSGSSIGPSQSGKTISGPYSGMSEVPPRFKARQMRMPYHRGAGVGARAGSEVGSGSSGGEGDSTVKPKPPATGEPSGWTTQLSKRKRKQMNLVDQQAQLMKEHRSLTVSLDAKPPPAGGSSSGQVKGQSKQGSLDKLINYLSKQYKNMTRKEMTDAILQVRLNHSGSLSGIPMGTIISEASSFLSKSQKKKQKKPSQSSDPVCPVCQEDLEGEIHRKLECGHAFHSNCIKVWVKEEGTCPVCRKHTLFAEDFPRLS